MTKQKFSIIAGLAFLLCFIFIGNALADLTTSPRNIRVADKSVLRSSLTAAATSATLEPLYKYVNGTRTQGCFDTGSGVVIIEDGTGRQEWASFDGKSCSASFVTTLSNMRRGLNPTTTGYAAGTGMEWDAGAVVRVIDWTDMYNNSLYVDLINKFTGSGSLQSDQTNQPFIFPNRVTTAQRDAFTYGTSSLNPIIFNTTTNTFQFYNVTQWVDNGSGAVVNATESTVGSIEIPEIHELRTSSGIGVVVGDAGGRLVVPVGLLVSTSSGTTASGRVITTNASGVFEASEIG